MERRKDRRTIGPPYEHGVWLEYAAGRPLYRMVWHRLESGIIPTGQRTITPTRAAVPSTGV